jgi:hypothetical protein
MYMYKIIYRHEDLLGQSTKTVRLLDEKMESFTTRMVKQQKTITGIQEDINGRIPGNFSLLMAVVYVSHVEDRFFTPRL